MITPYETGRSDDRTEKSILSLTNAEFVEKFGLVIAHELRNDGVLGSRIVVVFSCGWVHELQDCSHKLEAHPEFGWRLVRTK